jgi:DNA-binding transcriptional ArsR family regulator
MIDHAAPTIALVVTSCGRASLLHRTLTTFSQFNTLAINEAIVVEDGGLDHDRQSLARMLMLDPERLKIIKNEKNLGQIRSIDRAYQAVRSDYIFHCEDDWEFYRSGFMEVSLKILEADPHIFCVWLRAHSDTNGHPICREVSETADAIPYHLMSTGYKGVWHGFTLNPGLRRLADCLMMGPYIDLPLAHELSGRTRTTESDISIHYHRLGYAGAITTCKDGYVRHIGQDHHLANEWEWRTVVWAYAH